MNCELPTITFAFKEWSLVCEALGSGHQSILLRKGGITEGKMGFGFEHEQFLLFPTWFHGQIEKTCWDGASAVANEAPDSLTLEYVAVIEWSGFVTDREKLTHLKELHILHESVLDERFSYDAGDGKKGVHVAFVRVYRMEPPATLPMEKRFGGCRSWIKLPEITLNPLVSVLSDEEHENRRRVLHKAL
ncbi:MAG: hypothetical protein A3F67_04115 [Verrucomicrobia bacterium RIFCSPHIGHO2_12_FULL_41_10]|nr:MAG: hypothetical protein A3F67_04115 [Verrucomicrobia bacterium RIFCSPHIGHO2_12_FULL_41_10]HLB33216.1 DUF1802 family protein [Chthoniobacterales bacterium]